MCNVGGGLCVTGEGGGSNFLGAPLEAGGMPRVRSGSSSGIAADTLSEPAWIEAGIPGGVTPLPPPTLQGGPDLPGLLPKTLFGALVLGSGVPG